MAAKKWKWETKDPDEQYFCQHNWAARLLFEGADIGDTLRQMDDPDLTKRPSVVVDAGDAECFNIVNVPGTAKIRYYVRGGTINTEFIATVWTQQGNCYQERFVLPIRGV